MTDARPKAPVLPDWSRELLGQALEPGENPLVWAVTDIGPDGRFRRGIIVLSDRRLLECVDGGLGHDPTLSFWPVASISSLALRERAGVGQVDVNGANARITAWRYTPTNSRAAQRVVQRFEALKKGISIEADGGASVCPTCGAVLPSAYADCPNCSRATTEVATLSTFWRLLEFARPQQWWVLLGFLLTLASTAVSLIPPYLTQPLVDDVLIPRQAGQAADFSLIWWYLGLMLCASIIAWLLSWARTYVMAWVSERIAATLRERTYRHLLNLSVDYFGSKRTGDLISRIGSDTDRINNFLSVNLVDFANDCLMIAGTAAILFTRAPLLALATFIPLPLAYWLISLVRVRLRLGFDAGNRAWAAMTSVLADTIPGIRVVKAFAQEPREVERFDRANQHVVDTNDRVNRIWAFFGPMLALVSQGGLLVVWTLGAWMVFTGGMQVGILTMFISYLGRFYTRLESMSRMVQATQRANASARRIFEVLDRTPSVPAPTTPVSPGRLRGAIEINHVDFRYGTRQVLHDINLSIEPGEMIGLVGQTGAGKSTLINLICRFYDVQAGSIRVDGTDIRQYPVEAYRKNIGIVLQEPFLFFGSIAENIAYGKPEADRRAIIEAAKAARAHEFILRLPDGYDTPVGERGQSLSGGERQRISIARALLIDPAILILDEATSSVDTETEQEIQAALENLIRGRTTIAIAHRLSTLRRARRLVVLERGRIVEVGRHVDLLHRPDGAFARLHRAQRALAGVEE